MHSYEASASKKPGGGFEVEQKIRMHSKDTKIKKPYNLRKLFNWWLLALFWIVLIFPIFPQLFGYFLFPIFPQLFCYFLQGLTFLAIVVYSLIFLMRRKRFLTQKKQEAIETNYKESNSKRSFIWFCPLRDMTAITIIIWIAVVVLSMRTPPGLSITGTMFWNGEPAEVVSVILCPAATLPGPSFFGIGGGCDEKSVPRTIIDASGKYRFYNIPSGKYTIFYKWPDEDDWKLGETTRGTTLVIVKERGITKVDPIPAFRED